MSDARGSWVRGYFARQDDFTLWAIYAVWIIVQISTALFIATLLMKAAT